MNPATDNQILWYAMSAPYRNELKVQQALKERFGIEAYVPLRCEVVTRRGRKERRMSPAVSNLLFAHASRQALNEAKPYIPRMQFKTQVEEGRNRLIVIPDKQMQDFIRISASEDEKKLYLLPEEVDIKKGTRVRIIGGPFDGVEGVFIKVKGARNRRLVVSIEGLLSVASAEVTPDLIEVIE